MEGLLGTSAPRSSDITLLLYLLLIAPGMLVGFFFARRKMFVPHHKFTMTAIVILNWILIAVIMARSYSFALGAGGNLLIPTVHLLLGGSAQLLGTYLVLMMWTERTALEGLIPFRFKNIKRPMRLTLALWLATVLFGVGVYVTWYVQPGSSTPTTPEATEEAPEATEAALTVTEEAPEATEAATAAPAATEEG